MNKIKEFLHPQMITVLLFVLVSLGLFTLRVNLNYSRTPESSTYVQRETGTQAREIEKVPNNPQGKKGTARKTDVPTTAVTINHVMNVGESKTITVGKQMTYISVPSGHTVARHPGILKGNLGDIKGDGRWIISLQSQTGESIPFTARVN